MRKAHLVWILIGIAVLVVAAVKLTGVLEGDAYRSPVHVGQEADTPHDTAAEVLAAETEARELAKPYEEETYRTVPFVGSRVTVWVIAELHLLFAAFVLAVPIFALIIEIVGYVTGNRRYNKLAYEFTKLLSVSFSLTASFGALLLFALLALYPKFTTYLAHVFSPTFLPYVVLFFFEAFFLYAYYYGWKKFHPLVHIGLGVGLNVVGTAIMFIANGWVTFMMSPAGVADSGALINAWEALTNFTWMPMNIHRIIGNVAFGGSIAGAYAAWKFLHAKSDEERAHYDWMGYVGMSVAIAAFLPLPFAGYYLAREIYAFNQALGVMMMGGAFSWLFIIQAVLIGNLFLAANVYLWLGMGRVEGAQQFQKLIKWLLVAVAISFAIWATPRSVITTGPEVRAMGGSTHPIIGSLGYMAAKNSAVNILIMTTFVSYLLYRRTGKRPIVSWARKGTAAQFVLFGSAAAIVIFIGVFSYFVDAKTRIWLSVPQVLSVLIAMASIAVIDLVMMRKAEKTGEVHWGRMPPISQYVLIFIAITFTWLMAMMGYARAGMRMHWHVYGVIRDNSVDAFTPTLGFAANVTSVTTLIFFCLIAVVFWLTSLSGKQDWKDTRSR
jgi:cytochrome d ubiquinol oxidase subunit I